MPSGPFRDQPASSEDAEKPAGDASDDTSDGWLHRSPSMNLRDLCLKSKIASTKTLVEVYNSEEVDEMRKTLLAWLEQYPAWLEENLTEHVEAAMLEEYVELSNIKLRSKNDADLVSRAFDSLCNRSHRKRNADKDVTLSIVHFLQTMDDDVFREDSTLLLCLADDLLAQLKPKRNSFSKGNHERLGATLFALRQIMFVLQRISPCNLDPSDEDGVYYEFETRLETIVKKAKYFPTCFQALLVKEDLRLLASDSPDVMSSLPWRRLMHGLSGCVQIPHALRAALTADIDVDNIETGYQRLKTACADAEILPRGWHESLSRLNEAALISVQDPAKTDILTECSNQLLDSMSKMDAGQDRGALRYGMVCQLRVLAVDGQTPELRRAAAQEVTMIATKWLKCDDWDDDQDTIEAMLEALGDIHRTHENTDLVDAALEVVTNQASEGVQVGEGRQ